MAVPWSAIKSALLFFGPWLVPRILAYYRRLQAEANRQRLQQQRLQQLQGRGAHGLDAPVSAAAPSRTLTTRATVFLALLTGAALAWLLSAGLLPTGVASFLPSLAGGSLISGAPENIFVTTQSRLQAPTDVLFTRLAARRPGRVLTAVDEALRARFSSLDARLLYLQHGPDGLLGCLFCHDSTGRDGDRGLYYLAYAVVDLLAAHMANLVLVAITTSPLLMLGRKGKEGQQQPGAPSTMEADVASVVASHHLRLWRTRASVAVVTLAALDIYQVVAYDRRVNARATTLAALDPFFWRMRRGRGVVCAALLASLAALLRWTLTAATPAATQTSILGLVLFGPPPPALLEATAGAGSVTAARVAAATRCLGGVKSKLSAGAIVKNTALRDADLRERTLAYWAREVQLVAEAMEERDVLAGVHDALANHRIDLDQIARDAAVYAQNIVPPAQTPVQTQEQAAAAANEHGSASSPPYEEEEDEVEERAKTGLQPQPIGPIDTDGGARRRT